MRTTLSAASIALLLGTLAACAHLRIGTQEWFDQNENGRQTLAKRTGFDLQCPAAEMQFLCIGKDCKTIGAKGCGRQATYVFVSGSNGWIMNSEAKPGEK